MILTIDCSSSTAFISLSQNGKTLFTKENSVQKDHAGFLHVAIKSLMEDAAISFNELLAIAVVAGPGSYTGVRIGMATAKGLCFAASKPLIYMSALEILALACFRKVKDEAALYIPIIDARRMEVFTATYNAGQEELIAPGSHILTEESFADSLQKGAVFFTGNAVAKAAEMLKHANAVFCGDVDFISASSEMANRLYINNSSVDLINATPLYIKAFFEG